MTLATYVPTKHNSANGNIKYEDFLYKLQGAEDKGNYIAALCPFHTDNSPSLLVYRDGFFHCLGAECNRSGSWKSLWDHVSGRHVFIPPERRAFRNTNPISLVQETELTEEQFAYQAYIDLSTYTYSQYYLEIRGLADAIDLHEIGYHRGWYTFPVWDRDHNFKKIIWRTAPHIQLALGGLRYWTKGEASLYVPDWRLLDTQDYIIVVFGIMDALTLNKFRMPVVTPTNGHVFHAEWLQQYRKPIYVIPDKGEERKVLRMMGDFGWRGKMVRLDWPDGMKDANDFLKAGRSDELLAQLSKVIR